MLKHTDAFLHALINLCCIDNRRTAERWIAMLEAASADPKSVILRALINLLAIADREGLIETAIWIDRARVSLEPVELIDPLVHSVAP